MSQRVVRTGLMIGLFVGLFVIGDSGVGPRGLMSGLMREAHAQTQGQAQSLRGEPSSTSSNSRSKPTKATPATDFSGDLRWREVDALVAEQKLAEASSRADELLLAASQRGDIKFWTEALIRATQLRLGLHGYEAAVRFLKEQSWPKDPTARVLLNLVYAHTLMEYRQAYAYEIERREATLAGDESDLKAWSTDRIGLEIRRAFDASLSAEGPLVAAPPSYFAPFLSRGTYPEGVRPTLRDAVVYLAVAHLADTGYWRPEEQSAVYRLGGSRLLALQPSAVESSRPVSDEKQHPLVRLAALLNGHRDFHARAGRAEAKLEARYEIYRHLHAALEDTDDRRELRESLAREQASSRRAPRDIPWWAAGQALLAEMVSEEERPGKLIDALAIAKAGLSAGGSSVAGQLCRALVERIEAPNFSLSAMRVDGIGKDSILVQYKNLRELRFRAYAFDMEERWRTKNGHRPFPDNEEIEASLRTAGGSKPAAEWVVALPETKDHMEHRLFVTPPLAAKGAYIVLATPGSWAVERDSSIPIQGVGFIVSDLIVAHEQSESGGLEARVFSGGSGRPAAGARVSLWEYTWDKTPREATVKSADANGSVSFASPPSSARRGSYFLVARQGEDKTLAGDVWLGMGSAPSPTLSTAFIYTDRTVYRPQQKIFWKIAAFEGEREGARFNALTRTSIEVRLFDPNSQVVARRTVKTNAFGTASGEFVIPEGRPLGDWRLMAVRSGRQPFSQNLVPRASIRVEEYKRPTFEVNFKETATPLRLNKPATLVGEAKSYFGQPVGGARVVWKVSREQVLPWWWEVWGWRGREEGRAPEVVAGGTTTAREDGTFDVIFTPEADERLAKQKDLTYRFVVEADVTDAGGETRAASRTVRLGFVSIETRLAWAKGFFRVGQSPRITATRTSLDGQPRGGSGTYRVSRVRAPETTPLPVDLPRLPVDMGGFVEDGGRASDPNSPKSPYDLPGDRRRARWETQYQWQTVTQAWPDGEEVARGEVRHGKDGEGVIDLPAFAQAGVYRVSYMTKDDFGAAYEVSRDFIVASSGERPTVNVNLPLVLIAEAASVSVGGVARIFAHSGLIDQTFTYEVFRSGRLLTRRTLRSGRDPAVIEVPVRPRDRGGFTVVANAIRDHQAMRQEVSIFVPWDDRTLKMEFATFRDRLRPGEKETFSVITRTADGQPVGQRAAELLAYMYDRSLDIFGAHQPPSPLVLYPPRTGAPGTQWSLGVGPFVYSRGAFPGPVSSPNLTSYEIRFLANYGIGGPGQRGRVFMKGGMPMAASMAASMAESAAESAAENFAMDSAGAGAATEMRTQSSRQEDERGEPKLSTTAAEARPLVIRSNFSETAFWRPHLVTDAQGRVSFEFQAPDSVTSWNVWIHALTSDLKSGSLVRETKTVKELMVRPYAPRFLREGDDARIQVVVNNAAERDLAGEVTFDIEDVDTGKSVATEFGLNTKQRKVPFTAKKGGLTTVAFTIRAPKRVGPFAFVAKASVPATGREKTPGEAALSDGERRALPVLPSRMHLAQSRFVTLRDGTKARLEFQDLLAQGVAGSDEDVLNEKLVVTVDGQLFYGVLQAMPYLFEYPYECSEQILNRFVATGIASSVYKKYPAVAKMAKTMSQRQTPLEAFDTPDPNRRMALEESPWLLQAKGGEKTDSQLASVLDARVVAAQRDRNLGKLRRMQLPEGAWPWFQGGPPDAWMTLYLLHGFARASEFGVDVPKDMTARGWAFMKTWFDGTLEDLMRKDTGWELITFLNFALSGHADPAATGGAFSNDDSKRMLEFSFKHWKSHSPRLKAYLALTLARAGRDKDAKLVWDSVMDSARTNAEQGTFWAPEDRSWLWYNDTIESHAFALRTLMELDPKDPRGAGLVQWLFLNKKLNHWKSTRATAEVLYSLVHYLERTASLEAREEVVVQVNEQSTTFAFDPDKYTGKTNQLVIDAPKIKPQTGRISVEKRGAGFAFASATWHFSTDRSPSEEQGDFFSVSRRYFVRETVTGKGGRRETVLRPLTEGASLKVGDQIEVQISLRAKHEAEYVHLRDPRAAGLEPDYGKTGPGEEPIPLIGFASSAAGGPGGGGSGAGLSGFRSDFGLSWYEETRDSGANFFFTRVPVGEYTFKYRLRANMAGTFRVGPATVQSMYAPEFNAYSAGHTLSIESAGE